MSVALRAKKLASISVVGCTVAMLVSRELKNMAVSNNSTVFTKREYGIRGD
jgi:hypothetical protein